VKTSFKRHHDDEWFDEIRLVGAARPCFRLVTIPRYKTSGMSGDEWRVSTMWQTTEDYEGVEAGEFVDGWLPLDGGYHDLRTACAAFFGGIYGSHRDTFGPMTIRAIEFLRKGRVLWTATHDGESRPLLIVAGHLPWALIVARESQILEWNDWHTKCFQPGCNADATSTFRIKQEFCVGGGNCGAKRESYGRVEHRRFCQRHVVRGDSGLEDNDANYELVDGPGTKQPERDAADESPAVLGPIIMLSTEEAE